MGNDEKLTSRDEETPPHGDTGKDGGANERDRKDDGEQAASGADKDTRKDNPFASLTGDSSGDKESESTLGMPGFGLFEDEAPRGSGRSSTDEALKAARAGLENPPSEGTGWENTDSIEAHAQMPDEPAQPSGEPQQSDARARGQATVMPFPGAVRSADPAPSDMLGGSTNTRDTELFGSGIDTPAEALPELDVSAHDSIADAVQSALRNVYGGASPNADNEPVDLGSFTVADSLRHAASASAADDDDYWADSPANRRSPSRDELFGYQQGEGDADPVLDHLYGDRQSGPGPARSPSMSADASLRDLGDALGYNREGRERYDFDERSGRGGPRDFAEQGYGSGQRGYAGDHGYHDPQYGEADWDDQPYIVTSSSERDPSLYPTAVATSGQDSLAAGSQDSSHLLGAAGLGLIGGIALAGVLAVFVFNSFLDGVDGTGDATPKVVDRLSDPAADSGQPATTIDRQPSNQIAEPQPSVSPQPDSEQRVAATQPEEPATPAAEPESAPTIVEVEPLETPVGNQESGAAIVAADISGETGVQIPLDIRFGSDLDDSSLLSLKGLPVEARLSAGIDVGGGQWLLPPNRAEDLTVVVPQEAQGSHEVTAELLQDDAETAIFGPVSFMVRAGDTAAAEESPAQVASEQQGTTSEQAAQLAEVSDGGGRIETDFLTQMLIRDGNQLMRDGDILGARRLYEQAAADGNPEASLAMGRSFDPSYFEKLQVKTGKPDPATAFQWYKRALDGGLVTARVKIDGLKQWLQR